MKWIDIDKDELEVVTMESLVLFRVNYQGKVHGVYLSREQVKELIKQLIAFTSKTKPK